MTAKGSNTLLAQRTRDQQLFHGLQKHAGTLTSFTIASAPVTTADVTAALQARMQAYDAVQAAYAAWQTAVKAANDERAKTKALVAGVRASLQVMYAGAADTLGDFGERPRKARTPLTIEQQAAAQAKAKATRAARFTMGPRQKAKIKGTLPPTPTPSPAPLLAAPSLAPSSTPGLAPALASAPAPGPALAPAKPGG